MRFLRYPPGFFAPFQGDFWLTLVTSGTLLGMVLGGAAVAALLYLPAPALRSLAPEAPEVRTGPSWTWLVALMALAAMPRLVFLHELPGAAWTDGIYAIHAAASAGRFLWPWEVMPLRPPEVGNPSRVLVFGLYLDFVRAILSSCRDRFVAYALLSALPSICLPPALYLLVRRLTDEAAARISGLLCVFFLPALVQGRWGWDQQLMILLQLLVLERAVAGLSSGRNGPLAAAGLLAGVSLQTYIAAYPATAGLLGYLVWRALRERSARALGWFLAGLAPTGIVLAIVYLSQPAALGGRAAESPLLSGPHAWIAGSLIRSALYGLGAFSFCPDPNTRHGLTDSPPFALLLAVLLPLGFSRIRGAALRSWSPVLCVLASALAGGILALPPPGAVELSPNVYRTALALVLALPLAAVALAELRRLPIGSTLPRALPFLVALAIGSGDLARFLKWGLLTQRLPQMGQLPAAAGAFLDVAGESRAALDPVLFTREDSPLVAGFWMDRAAPLAPLRIPAVRELDPAAASTVSGLDWYLTNRPPPGVPGLRLGAPNTPEGSVFAVNLAKIRRR